MKEYKEILSQYLTNERLDHSISTGNFMKKYAKYFDIDDNKAYIAGLFHDIAKELSNSKIIELAKNFNNRNIIQIKYFDAKLNHPFLLHGNASSEIIFSQLNIKDPQILQAISNHTYGGENLHNLAKFTFVSDFCEPLRDYAPSIEVNRIITKEKNLIKACLHTYIFLIERIVKKQKFLCKESIDGYNETLNEYLGLSKKC